MEEMTYWLKLRELMEGTSRGGGGGQQGACVGRGRKMR